MKCSLITTTKERERERENENEKCKKGISTEKP
jgi:hypothetical protein